MHSLLNIITVTKDDLEGAVTTIRSTRKLRLHGVVQTVVDGSAPEIATRVATLVEGEVNVRYLRQEGRGISPAFNQGLSHCQAQWVWFLNGGDQVHPEVDPPFLIKLVERSRSDAMVFGMELTDAAAMTGRPPLWAFWPPMYWVPHPATLLRRSLFDRYGLFDEDYQIAMDADLWVRFFSQYITVDVLSIPLSLYDQTGVSSTDLLKVTREADKVVVRNFRMLFRLWLKNGDYLWTALQRHFCSERSRR